MSEAQNAGMITSRNNLSFPRAGDSRSAQRKPAPSPLQVSQISTPTTDSFVHDSPVNFGSPNSLHGGSTPSYSPRSPHYSPVLGLEQSKSPRERLEEFLGSERSGDTKASTPQEVHGVSKSSPLTTPRGDTYPKVRNFSAPSPKLGEDSPRHDSPDMSSSTSTIVGTSRLEPRFALRTSSIDSTVSSVSSTTSYSNVLSPNVLPQEISSPSPHDIAQFIASAGSAEAAIHQLLKEKKRSQDQNVRLWKLMNGQRTLVFGLKKDLERALQDKERYKKRLKDHLAQVPPVPTQTNEAKRKGSPAASASSGLSESQDDILPIQRHSVLEQCPDEALSKAEGSRPLVKTPVSMVPEEEQPSSSGLGLVGMHHELPQGNQVTQPVLENKAQIPPLKPLEIPKQPKSSVEEMILPRTPELDSAHSNPNSRGSFTARRSITTPQKSHPSPLIGSSLSGGDPGSNSPGMRKLPPAPLNLRKPAQVNEKAAQLGPEEHSGSEYDDVAEVDELPALQRGRKKTREEDDKEREIALLKEQERRSLSKKDKRSKSATVKQPPKEDILTQVESMPKSPAFRGFSPDNMNDLQRHLSPPTSLAGILSRPTSNGSSTMERTLISPMPLSPGLPISPRPIDRLVNSPPPRLPRDSNTSFLSSPPISPRTGLITPMPLSPRPPRHPIPLPPHTPLSMLSPPPTQKETQAPRTATPPEVRSTNDKDTGTVLSPVSNLSLSNKSVQDDLRTGGVYKGLVSDAHPDLLLPPNALPSILVKVTSSRLKPSRHSTIMLKLNEEEPVFTLGISARSDQQQLWRVEKPTLSLPSLDHQLKQACSLSAKLPERSLFTGHAPAKIDARRLALEEYFEAILDTPMDENAALIVCRYLSTQVIQVEESDIPRKASESHHNVTLGLDGRIVKEGFLTKRGKNFGGWKARFFVLDEPVLRYYESPGGPLLGTIKLQHAQIGRQNTQHTTHSPSRTGDPDSEFRHAILILEPKRKDSSSTLRHVLCAESDAERDQWVEALLQYVGVSPNEDDRNRPSGQRNDSGSSKISSLHSAKKDEGGTEKTSIDGTEALQALSYENTVSAPPPSMRMVPNRRQNDTPSPVNTPQNGHTPQPPKPISGPTNGTVIQDAGAWGNKPLDSPKTRDKDQRKRGFFGFRNQPSSELSLNIPAESHSGPARPHNDRYPNVRPVFGIPLAEAVEYCMAPGTSVCLPAVVYRCLEYLEAKDAQNEEGIFRLSGSSVVIRALRERFNTEGDIDLLAEGQYYDVHAVASLLKMYLRELPVTVLTRELHLEFLQVLELEDKAKKIPTYNTLVHRLPLPNWTMIRALSAFLIGIVNNSNINKMSVRNVGIVFSPTLNIPAPIFSAFLTDFDTIFGTEPEESSKTSIEISAPSPLTPEDIRSPRRQLFSDIPTPSYNQEAFPRGGLGVTYEEVLHKAHEDLDTGFIPMQPSYEAPTPNVGLRPSAKQDRSPSPVTMPGPEYGAFRRTLDTTSGMRDTKARRRESSMLMMGMNMGLGLGQGQRKSSMPSLRYNPDGTPNDKPFEL